MWIPVESSPMNTPRNSAEVKPGEVVSVSWLNRAARNVLEESFPLMWIAGEVSTLTRAASGHVYFTLKDEQAQVRCTMWRNRAQLLPFRLEHGMRVEVRALVTLFEIMDVAARADLKADVLKDIEKQKHVLDGYRGNPAISEAALDGIIAQLDRCFGLLNTQAGKTGQPLSENEWLMSIRSRAGIPGGTCGFDLPAYYAWQHHTPAVHPGLQVQHRRIRN